MPDTPEEKLLTWVKLGRHKVYRFYEHDEDNVKLVESESQPDHYVIISNQALGALASVVRQLADKLTV